MGDMRRALSLLLLSSLVAIAGAQKVTTAWFQDHPGANIAYSQSDGDFLVAGTPTVDVVNPAGQITYSYAYPYPESSIYARKENDALIAVSNGGGGVFVSQFSPNGTFLSTQGVVFPALVGLSCNPTAIDVLDNKLYIVGSTSQSTQSYFVAKIDLNTMTATFARSEVSGGTSAPNRIVADSVGRSYVVVPDNSSGLGDRIEQYTANGNHGFDIDYLGGLTDGVQQVIVDSSDRLVVCAVTQANGSIVDRYSSVAGNPVLGYRFFAGNFLNNFKALRLDSQGNILTCGEYGPGAVVKLRQSDLTLLWNATTGATNSEYMSDLKLDSNDDVYAGSVEFTGVGTKMACTKFSASGVRRFHIVCPDPADIQFPSLGFHRASGDILLAGKYLFEGQLALFRQAPVAANDQYAVRRNRTYNSTQPVTVNDTFAVGATVFLLVPPAHGSVTVNVNGSFTYTPNQGYTGTDSFQYRMTKPGLDWSDGTVQLNVN